MNNQPGNCSKNYVDCRRHPESELPLSFRAQIHLERSNPEVLFDYKKLLNKTTSGREEADRRRELQKRKTYYATLPENRYKDLLRTGKGIDGEIVTSSILSQVKDERADLLKQYRAELERTEYYSQASNMDEFRTRISNIIVKEGEFYNPNSSSSGPSIGDSVREHFKQCGVYGINEYKEVTDGPTRVGIYSQLSCKCKEHYKAEAYIRDTNFTEIMRKLIVD